MERVPTGLTVVDDAPSFMTTKIVMKMQDEERYDEFVLVKVEKTWVRHIKVRAQSGYFHLD